MACSQSRDEWIKGYSPIYLIVPLFKETNMILRIIYICIFDIEL